MKYATNKSDTGYFNKTADESTSLVGQYVHDAMPVTFWFMDIDGVVAKKSTRVERIIEGKDFGGSAKRSQRGLLPRQARRLARDVADGKLNVQSGVFVVQHPNSLLAMKDAPRLRIQRVIPHPADYFRLGPTVDLMDQSLVHLFLGGDLLPPNVWAQIAGMES